MVHYQAGLSLIQQVAPNFVGVNKQPAKIMGRHMDLGEACIKWVLFLMNIFVVFAGAGFVVLGLYIKLKAKNYEEFLGGELSISWLFAGVGIVIFLVGGMGCCGANKSSTLFLTCYFLFMLAAVFVQVVVVLIIISNKDDIKSDINEIFMEKIRFYGAANATDNSTKPFDFIQTNLKCCGVKNGTHDWSGNASMATVWLQNHTYDIPDSCCVTEVKNCGIGGVNVTNDTVHQTGCESKLYDITDSHLPTIGGIGAALIGLQLFGACGACLLKRAIEQHFAY